MAWATVVSVAAAEARVPDAVQHEAWVAAPTIRSRLKLVVRFRDIF